MPKSSLPASARSASSRYRLLRHLRRRANDEIAEIANEENIRNRAAVAEPIGAPAAPVEARQQNPDDGPVIAVRQLANNRLIRDPELVNNGVHPQVQQHENNQDRDGNVAGEDADSEHNDQSSEEDADEESDGEAGGDDNNPGHVEGVERDIFGGEDSGESDGELSGDEEENVNNDDEILGNQTLYRGAPLTVRESAAAVVTFMMNHNLTASCVEDLMTLISLHCPRDGFVKLSLYKLKKYFNFAPGPVKKKFYCSVCKRGLAAQNDVCPSCQRRRPVSYFIQTPLVPQLEKMFARPQFYENLQHRFGRPLNNEWLSDIYDGELYKEQVQLGFLDRPNNFSMSYYTDGVPVFKSKNFSFWGFFLLINELPYKERVKRENILLAGLWFGPHKPEANLFMYSFLEDFRKIYQGVQVHVGGMEQRTLVRGLLLTGVADTPARSTFLNCVHHNGFFGCAKCEIPGVTVNLPNGNDTHAYPYQQQLPKRTLARMVAQARDASAINREDFNIVGVKGPTALRLFMPNFVKGAAIDVMHLLMGLVKKLMTLHFDSAHGGRGFSLRAVMAFIDELLSSMKPPKFVHRLPRSIEDFIHWKASELKAWFFYYSVPILEEVMRPVYFNHYLKLVIALSYLGATSVSVDMINKADQLLHEFVREFQDLYGLQFCSINVHMLLHLADCVRENGPTWIYACFPLEDLNGQILRVIHGKTNIDSQVSRMHWQHLDMPMKLRAIRDGPIKEYCLNRRNQLKLGERLCASCYVVGSFTRRNVNDPFVIRALQISNIRHHQFRIYYRLLKNNQVYVSESYTRDLKQLSSYVSYIKNNEIAFGTVHSFVKVLHCACNFICDCAGEHYAIIRQVEVESDLHLIRHQNLNLKYMHRCRMSLLVSAVLVRNLKTVCFFMTVNNKKYIAQPINSHEVE